MDLLPSACVFLLLLSGAAGMMVWNVHSWRAACREETRSAELDYRRRQFRRRIQTSAMIALIAVAMFVGQLMADWLQARHLALVFWLGVVLLVGWVALLAVADIAATRYHFSRLRHDNLVEQVRLQAEIRRLETERRNKDNGKGER